MADISKIILPNGSEYNLKDSRVDSISAYYTSETQMITFNMPDTISQSVSITQDPTTSELTIA